MAKVCALFLLASASAFLAACGGGGGSGGPEPPPPPSASITLSADQLSFATTGPWDDVATPRTVRLTGTVQGSLSGTLNIVIQVNNPELVSVDNFVQTGADTGEVTVTAANTSTLSIGRHTGSIVVRACTNDTLCNSNQLQGSPKTIAITYDIPTNVDGDAVMPHVVSAGTPGSVIIRGGGFPAGATVSFGGVAAGTVNVVSSSEIRATYPALSAGTHAVAINSGAVTFSGSIAALADTSYDAVFLPHPSGVVLARAIEYDAERRALLVPVAFAGPLEDVRLMRYAYGGNSWSSPTLTAVPGLRQVKAAPDGARLLLLCVSSASPQQTLIEERDPVTLELQRTNSLDLGGAVAGAMAFTNDSQALLNVSRISPMYFFGLHSRQTRRVPIFPNAFDVVASADGGLGAFVEGYVYDPSSGRPRNVPGTGLSFLGEASADLTGARIQSGRQVLDDALASIGNTVVTSQSGGAAAMNRAGTRMYTVEAPDSSSEQLFVWDLTQPPIGGQLVQIGAPIDLLDDPGLRSELPHMTISPDGRTLFTVGTLGIVVMPAPQ